MSESVERADASAPQSESLVTRTHVDGVAVLEMRYRPHNLVGPKLTKALVREMNAAEGAGARAIVLKSGLRHFSAGADLDQFTAKVAETGDQPSSEASSSSLPEDEFEPLVRFLRSFELRPVPIIASVHGVCLGGGLELALACDYIIAASSAKIGSVEVTLGLHPLMGATQRQVQRIGVARAKEMSMLGRRYDPEILERWGLINLTVADDLLDATTMTIAQEFANGPTVAHAATKRLAYIAANEGVLAADQAMSSVQKPIWESEDLRIALTSFMKNGPGLAKFKGV